MKDRNYERLQNVQQEHGLEFIEITGGRNGYPAPHLGWGIIGFESLADAKATAEELNCELADFHSRDGWHFWENTGRAYEPYSYDERISRMGNDYSYILPERVNEEVQYWADWVSGCIDNTHNDATAFIKELKERANAIEKLVEMCELADEDEVVITFGGRYYEVIKRAALAYDYDTHRYAIGVFVPNDWTEITFKVQDREAGNVIERGLSYKAAQELVAEYEATDRKEGNYTSDFYEIAREEEEEE